MKQLKIVFFLLAIVVSSCSQEKNLISFKSDHFEIGIDGNGVVHELNDIQNKVNYLAKDTTAFLLSIRVESKIVPPTSVTFKSDHLIINYLEGITAKVKVEEKATHITFELVEITTIDGVELALWGPVPTTIKKIIGETVGVVRGENYAIGIQALNAKTLGGYPWKDDDTMPQFDIFDRGDFSDISEQGKGYTLYRVEAAKPETFGSTLQAYCRNRFEERIIATMGHQKYVSPIMDDKGIIGSKIALFGCPVDQTLETIGKIELAENLPHPMINGQWGKQAKGASAAYLIMDFSEETIDEAIAYTKKAGLDYLYHPGPFKNWGHFELNEAKFPNGWDGLKSCVEKANASGIDVGLHTLANFITTDDAYVTPVPDQRLAKVGGSQVTMAVNSTQTEIPIKAPDFFAQYDNNNLHTVRIGNELIRYNKVSDTAPWKLIGCERGAWNTVASAHKANGPIDKLADHAYKVFLTDPELTGEMAEKLAELFNYTGLRQISFDGLEGNHSTGMGNYGENLFTSAWWNGLSKDIKEHTIIDASRTSHYFWHMYSRMNWGEPWYAGFRESQTEYRLKNQPYFKRNLMPAMLGWFSLKPDTPIEDIEWMLARSAGFDAGYAFVASKPNLKANGHTQKILEAVGQWEKARLANVFTESQKERMTDIANEFHLETIAEGQWLLYEISSFKFRHEAKTRQPGEPLFSEFQFETAEPKAQMQFILTAKDATLSSIKLELNKSRDIILPITLSAGESIRYAGGTAAFVYDTNLNITKEINMDAQIFEVDQGKHTILVDCEFNDKKDEPSANLEIRIPNKGETVSVQ